MHQELIGTIGNINSINILQATIMVVNILIGFCIY